MSNNTLFGYGVFEVPYCNKSTEKDLDIIKRNKLYAQYVNSVAWVAMVNPPMMPLLSYMDLPQPWIKAPDDEEAKTEALLHCGYFPGKLPCWRNFDLYREQAGKIYFAVDYGMTSGMKAVYEKYKHKSVLVTLRGIENFTRSKRFLFFEDFPPDAVLPPATVPLWSFNPRVFPPAGDQPRTELMTAGELPLGLLDQGGSLAANQALVAESSKE
jgi:hypothetical protein